MPAPATSIHPDCLHTAQPFPLQTWHVKSTSTDGSVNGKKCGRNLTVTPSPIIAFAKYASTLLRSASETGFCGRTST